MTKRRFWLIIYFLLDDWMCLQQIWIVNGSPSGPSSESFIVPFRKKNTASFINNNFSSELESFPSPWMMNRILRLEKCYFVVYYCCLFMLLKNVKQQSQDQTSENLISERNNVNAQHIKSKHSDKYLSHWSIIVDNLEGEEFIHTGVQNIIWLRHTSSNAILEPRINKSWTSSVNVRQWWQATKQNKTKKAHADLLNHIINYGTNSSI